jgi:hypothetical protein
MINTTPANTTNVSVVYIMSNNKYKKNLNAGTNPEKNRVLAERGAIIKELAEMEAIINEQAEIARVNEVKTKKAMDNAKNVMDDAKGEDWQRLTPALVYMIMRGKHM